MRNCKIEGFGYAKAKRAVTNDEIAKHVETNDEWIKTRTGISQRYVSEDENTSDLALIAAQKAIADAGIDKREIDLIITATFTPDTMSPSTACLVQGKLGLNDQKVMAFDLNAACSGFLYALQVAHMMIATKQAKCALVIGAEVISKYLNWEDRSTCIIFGDGAGALILKQCEEAKAMYHFARSKGDLDGIIHCDGQPLKEAFSQGEAYRGVVRMNGSETFRFAIKAMQESIEEVLKQANVKIEKIDWFVPHQANARIISNVCKHTHIDMDHVYMNISECGNTSAASIPLALGQMKEEGLLKEGMKIVLSGFGAGFTWASAYIEL